MSRENFAAAMSYAKSLYPIVALSLAAYVFTSARVAQLFAMFSGLALLAMDAYARHGEYGEPWYPMYFLLIVVLTSALAFYVRRILKWRHSKLIQ